MKKAWLTLALVVFSSVPVLACDSLIVMGFPESCVRACQNGWHSGADNTMCFFDVLIGW